MAPGDTARLYHELTLGEPLAGLLLTCVGIPAYRNRRGGSPGAPAAVVLSPPGLTLPGDDA